MKLLQGITAPLPSQCVQHVHSGLPSSRHHLTADAPPWTHHADRAVAPARRLGSFQIEPSAAQVYHS
jgi:hypothetical protein